VKRIRPVDELNRSAPRATGTCNACLGLKHDAVMMVMMMVVVMVMLIIAVVVRVIIVVAIGHGTRRDEQERAENEPCEALRRRWALEGTAQSRTFSRVQSACGDVQIQGTYSCFFVSRQVVRKQAQKMATPTIHPPSPLSQGVPGTSRQILSKRLLNQAHEDGTVLAAHVSAEDFRPLMHRRCAPSCSMGSFTRARGL